ncbi:hypothetical protein B6S12_10550 [Helicobacter valdiviensis]|uniref:SprT-like domain-containing protein n=1 Tax=Helicobacter valdiviensis TaxID=1458358 RepID=A0A2W6MRQ6_9HELI|nr:hypothetical protein [Helicobacter valdiviensis]PZT47162.1 hypothetical protein B6S12_10550 [Helicobacter valdiviensis]
MAQAELLENLSKQAKFAQNEEENIVSLKVAYPEARDGEIVFNQKRATFLSNYLLEKESVVDATKPFAPGTYIELVAPLFEGIDNIEWGYSIKYSTADTKEKIVEYTALDIQETNFIFWRNPKDANLGFSHQIGFFLPLQREQEEEFNEYKIIVYAFRNSMGRKPNENDPRITIDMSFRVGKGNIEEFTRIEQVTLYQKALEGDLDSWNSLRQICNIKEAVGFLKENKNQLKKFYHENPAYNLINEDGNPKYNVAFDYFGIYQQLAGKIAYIYYRFDLANEEFIKNASNGNEYLKTRKDFINAVQKIFINDYKQKLKNCFTTHSNKEFYIKNFINDVGKKLRIAPCKKTDNTSFMDTKVLCMPKVVINNNLRYLGSYNRFNNTMKIRIDSDCNEEILDNLLDTIIHELRHFYVYYQIDNGNTNELLQFIYYNAGFFYDKNFVFFGAFKKKCMFFDESALECKSNQETPLYYLQPSERDARICACKFMQE